MKPRPTKFSIRGALITGALLLVAGGTQSAWAETNGLKFGDARVHPFFLVDGHYDSAAITDPTTGDPNGDLILHFRPGLKLDMPSPTLAVALNGNMEYVLYTGAGGNGSTDASHFGADADLDVAINRDGKVYANVGDHFSRSDRLMGAPSISYGALSLYNDARLKLGVRPAGGALEIEPEYHFTAETFTPINSSDNNSNSDLKVYDYTNHTVSLVTRWKFLPKTAVLLDAAFASRDYLESGSVPINTLKASLGLAGLVTTHFSTILRLGWGQDLTKKSYSSLVGQAELGYMPSQQGSVRLGYVRTFEPTGSPSKDESRKLVSYGDDRAYLDGRVVVASKLTLHGTFSLDFLSFNNKDGSKERSDMNTNIVAGFDYEVVPWFIVGASYGFTRRDGEEKDSEGNMKDTTPFNRHETHIQAQLVY